MNAQQQVDPKVRELLERINSREELVNFSTYIEAPKFAHIKQKLIDVAPSWGVRLNFTDNDRGWIRETIYFDITGKRKDVNEFWDSVSGQINKWNELGLGEE